jgi:hypothetical protein
MFLPVATGLATYQFVIYRDEYAWPKWLRDWKPRMFGHQVQRKFARRYTGQANHNDPATLLNVLMQQTYLDWYRAEESDLLPWSMDVWSPDEYDCAHHGCDHRPPCRALLQNWRHVPQHYKSSDGHTWAA